MPKTYSLTRKINLGKYGLQYEAIDIAVENADTFADAVKDMNAIRKEIHDKMAYLAKQRLDELGNKANLTFKEESERLELKKLDDQSSAPF